MHINMLRRVNKILRTVKNLGKRSGTYESLIDADGVHLSNKELKTGYRAWSRSKMDGVPDDIPRGYLAVYVGNERKRFVVRTKYLSYEIFKELLKRSEEELGFDHEGGLTIACEPVLFEHILWLLETNSPTATTTHFQELLKFHAF